MTQVIMPSWMKRRTMQEWRPWLTFYMVLSSFFRCMSVDRFCVCVLLNYINIVCPSDWGVSILIVFCVMCGLTDLDPWLIFLHGIK